MTRTQYQTIVNGLRLSFHKILASLSRPDSHPITGDNGRYDMLSREYRDLYVWTGMIVTSMGETLKAADPLFDPEMFRIDVYRYMPNPGPHLRRLAETGSIEIL